MSEPYIGEIRMFGGNFAPAGWRFCDGSLLAIAEYDTLFSVIGTTYGGDGYTNFAVPDLRGRSPLHWGTGTGLPPYVQGQSAGQEQVTLWTQHLPAHAHPVTAAVAAATDTAPTGHTWAASTSPAFGTSGTPATMASAALGPVGGNQPHDNRVPSLGISFIISLFGIYPSQN
jgi:microcystin-dependent protein